MKRFLCTSMIVLIVLSLFAGCSTIKKAPIPKFSKSTKKSDEGLYSKVPASMRADVKEAEFDLKRAKSNMILAEKKLELAELKKERELLRTKHADYNKKLAEVLENKADLRVEITKMEAIDNSNLGDKESNIKSIASLKTKKLGIESKEIDLKAEMDTLELKIKQLSKKITAQEKKINKK